MNKQSNTNQKPEPKKKGAVREYSESLLVALAIALVIRALVIYPFRIPTGSMEGSLLVGDFLLANKFVYGIRSPDWIGIPYTKAGFKIPFFRTPGFRQPKQGDVVIFKYPQDDMLNYIKRCVAVSGDSVEIRNEVLYVNGQVFPNPPKSKFIDHRILPENYQQQGIFPPGAGNIDNYGPIYIPAKGDTFQFTESNRDKWFERFQLICYEGNKIKLNNGTVEELKIENQNQWYYIIRNHPPSDFSVNGQSLADAPYTVSNKHYFMMGDNRDNSLDSRYWGTVPSRYIVGEGLIVYWSWDKDMPLYRLFKKVRWNRFLNIIR